MTETHKFVYNVIIFVSIFLFVVFGESKLILVIFFVYFMNNFSPILLILLYSFTTLQKSMNVIMMPIVINYILILLLEK
jgi:hypothetical protein